MIVLFFILDSENLGFKNRLLKSPNFFFLTSYVQSMNSSREIGLNSPLEDGRNIKGGARLALGE